MTDQKNVNPEAPTDLTGRDRILHNVLASWGGHSVFVLAGFILPRFIDRSLGQASLGIWDFGWSIVGYFGIAQFGVGVSLNRYVAKYYQEQDTRNINHILSSGMFLQLVAAIIILGLTSATVLAVPSLLTTEAEQFQTQAQFLVWCLGIGLAVQISCDAFSEIMVGFHRWDLYNATNAIGYAISVLAMIAVLLLGGGMRELAGAHLGGTLATEVLRMILAIRLYPSLQLHWRFINREHIRGLLGSGGKVLLNSMSGLLLYQTNSMLIVRYLGTEALALYARPMALIRHAGVFVRKFAHVLMPTASSMQAAGEERELRTFLLNTVQYSLFMTLPSMFALAILGGSTLHVWMGAHYENALLVVVLALGHIMSISQAPIMNILTGLDKHGAPAMATLVSALVAVVLNIVTLGALHLGLVGAAMAVVVPLTLVDGVFLPYYACRHFRISLQEYLRHSWSRPLFCTVPFATWLLLVQWLLHGHPTSILLYGLGGGGLILGLVYWRWVLPDGLRRKICLKLGINYQQTGYVLDRPKG